MDSTSKPKPNRAFPYSLLIGVACIVLVVICQAYAPSFSYQFANMLSYLFGLIALLAIFTWWLRHIAPNRTIGFVPVAIGGIAFAYFMSQYELHGVSGELVPEFHRRDSSDKTLPSVGSANTSDASESQQVMLTEQSHPEFMGRGRNGRIEKRLFDLDWNTNAPEMVWSQPVGSGLAGVAVVEVTKKLDTDDSAEEGSEPSLDTVKSWYGFTLEQRGEDECILCYDLSDGSVVWEFHDAGYHSHFLGDEGPRTTPTIDAQGRLYAQGATGKVWCLNALTGDEIWKQDLVELANSTQEASETAVLWGRAGSPLRVDDKVIVPFGGSPINSSQEPRAVIAFNAASGEIDWQSAAGQISYASPVVATIAGVRQIMTVDQNYARGWSIDSGEKLWEVDWPGLSNAQANCSNPIALPGDRILLTKEYGGGAKLVQLSRDPQSDQWTVQEEWSDNRLLKTKFTNAVIDGEYAYAISNGMLECVRWEDGDRRWRQPRSGRVGHGHLVLVEDVLISSTEEGAVVLINATPDGYEELGRFQAIEGKTWNPPTVFSNYVLVRNGMVMALWKLKARD